MAREIPYPIKSFQPVLKLEVPLEWFSFASIFHLLSSIFYLLFLASLFLLPLCPPLTIPPNKKAAPKSGFFIAFPFC